MTFELHAVNRMPNAVRRIDPPPEEAIGKWIMLIDMDKNQPTWAPKDLFDEYQRLRFSEEGAP
jgi:hypothetical protein